jgi:hypothetical protein
MAQYGVGRLLVVDPHQPRHLIGIVTRSDPLKPRFHSFEEEQRTERILHWSGSGASQTPPGGIERRSEPRSAGG